MGKVVLIAGSETLLGRKLVEKELDRGNRVIAPVNSKKETGSNESSRENLLVLPWNKSSLFSAKTVIRESLRKWNKIDRALVIDTALSGEVPFIEFSLAEIDERVDREIKGLLYLTRELISLSGHRGLSHLSFIRTIRPTGEGSSLDKGCSGFFRDFSDRIICEKRDGLFMCGFINTTANVESGAENILEICESKPEKVRGEWLRISEKRNLFSSLPLEKRA